MSNRSRCQLHHTHFDDFVAFCESAGFKRVETKDPFEVLRMTPPYKGTGGPLIVHSKSGAKEHYTTWGISADMAQQFFRVRRGKSRSTQEAVPQ
jgi:hypothetical protein